MLGIENGSAYSKSCRILIDQLFPLDASDKQVAQRMYRTEEFAKWEAANSPKKNGSLINASIDELCRLDSRKNRVSVIKSVRELIIKLAASGLSLDRIVEHVRTSTQWEQQLLDEIKIAHEAVIAEERRRLERVERGKKVARMPRDMRLRAWKVIRTRTVQHEDKTILAQHLRNQERYFLEMERFAKQAQAYIDEDKASIEAARIQDEYRRRRQAEERALRDKLKDARLEALEKEITLEEAQQFVRENIPHNARSGFREWFKKEYGGDLSCLMAAAKEFIALQGEKPAKDIKDKVIARPFGTDIPIENFNSVHAMMQETGTGNDADARQFRLAVKDQGVAIWPDDDPRKNSQTALDGRRWEVLLPHLRPVDAELDDYVPEKRKGRRAAYGALSRPDQKAFSDSVYDNCYGQGVVTGARSRRRCEAAHLVEHCKDGVDHWSNGLWLSIDIHRLFDANQCAINPETLCVHFTPDVLAEDEDLKGLEGQSIAMTKKPINAAFLWARWEVFTSGD